MRSQKTVEKYLEEVLAKYENKQEYDPELFGEMMAYSHVLGDGINDELFQRVDRILDYLIGEY